MIEGLGFWHAGFHLTHPHADLLLHMAGGAAAILLLALSASLVGFRMGPALRHHVLAAGAIAAVATSAMIGLGRLQSSPPSPGSTVAAASSSESPISIVLATESNWVQDPADLPGSSAGGLRIALLIWGGGVLLLLGGTTRSWLQVRGILRGAKPVTDPAWTQDALEISRRAGVRPPQLVSSADTPSAFATGIFRTTVTVDRPSLSADSAVRRAILLHEIEHLARRDPAWGLVRSLVRALLWPIPPAWWVAGAMRLEAERCCDQAVINGGVSRSGYIRQLMYIDAHPARLGWSASHLRSTQLYRRLRSLGSEPRAVRPGLGSVLLIWGTLLGAGLWLVASEPAPGQAVFFAEPGSQLLDSRQPH